MNSALARHRITATLAGLMIAGSGLLVATPATAAVSGPAPVPAPAAATNPDTATDPGPAIQPDLAATEPQGKVVSKVSLYIREFPRTNSTILGSLPPGAVVYLHCKVTSENVDGNNLWYKLGDGRPGYVAARYVQNLSFVPWCN
ncbi:MULTISPECIES: SH3 domain-containing protein [unclassified Streptomyces]|uniref:SH3 domain-containing protein n=1 Tax=unclassified Streptomyces TaxID=2593676 RepID=UPI002E2BD2A3|nr:SH3 domain-containing protein [Streptomyces sp. NBC_00223]